ncbi:MAG: hypothetical protein HC889_20825 [Synechococcaceae cyanobacterium SM1_2_3]|nr:hypothetical protein [Synechococcaceae cyanobacterium SM1_2_3]
MIWGIAPEDIPAYSGRLAPFLLNFSDRSLKRATAVELLECAMDGTMQIYVADDFKAVCMTSVHPEHVEINCCSGEDREDWQDDLEAHIAEWAMFLGKKRVIMIARPGWQKWAKTKGYRQTHVELARELDYGR